MTKILLLGAGGAAAANFVKSLRDSRRKYFIVGTDTNKYHLELSNVDVKCIVPSCDSLSYIAAINKIISDYSIEIVYPQSDVEVLTISKNKKRVNAKVLLPSADIVELCQNKRQLTQLLRNEKIPVAKSIDLEDDSLVQKFIKQEKKVWIRAIRGAGSKAALPVSNMLQINGWVDYWKGRGLEKNDFILSEYLPGREYAFQSVWKEGELIVSSARERIEYLFGSIMPSGQSSSPSVARTIHNKNVNQIAIDAIRKIDPQPQGIYSVDLKENKKGVPCITEINAGRFFTTSYFFTKAGCNMPDIFIQLALDKKVDGVKKVNAVISDQYWLRMIDMGEKLVSGDSFKKSKKARGIIFDFDGTLCNLPVDWNRLKKQIGILASGYGFKSNFVPLHKELAGLLSFVKRTRGQIALEALSEKINTLISEAELNAAVKLKISSEIIGVLDELQRKGIKFGIVSNNFSTTIEKVLKNSNISCHAIIGFDNVKKPKPDPLPVTECLSKLGLRADEVVGIGNSKVDRAAFTSAKLMNIKIGDYKNKKVWDFLKRI